VRTDEVEVVDVPAEGGDRQFVIRVTHVSHTNATTTAKAAAAHQRVSHLGQDLLRETADTAGADPFDAYRYRPDLGVVVRASKRATAASAGGATRTRPGEVVVWRTRAP
jgi:hypothetical protein